MLKTSYALIVAILTLLVSPVAFADSHENMQQSESSKGAAVYIISPKDGETVGGTFVVKFGLLGMGVAPAGVKKDNTGHHHLLIDGEIENMNMPIGANAMHFGGGQTETEISLEPGPHTLQLILADYKHIPHNPPLTSELITITVK
jgi:hypothetical protein